MSSTEKEQIRPLIYRITASREFGHFIMGVIIVAGVLVGFETSKEIVEQYSQLLYTLDLAIIVLFTIEVAFKLWTGFHYGEEGQRQVMVPTEEKPDVTWSDNRQRWLGQWFQIRWARIRRFFQEPWNIFDFAIVALSFIPIIGSGVLYLRLARLFRILRLVRIIPTLPQAHIATVWGARKAFVYILFLMALIFYMYGIAGVFLFEGNDPVHFGDLRLSVLSLFRVVTLEGWTNVMYTQMYGCDVFGYGTMEHLCRSPESFPLLAPLYFVSFILIGSIIFLNMFVGIIVTAMDDAARTARERQVYDALNFADENSDSPEETREKPEEALKALDLHLTVAEGKLEVLREIATEIQGREEPPPDSEDSKRTSSERAIAENME